jgi:hypothetical protein
MRNEELSLENFRTTIPRMLVANKRNLAFVEAENSCSASPIQSMKGENERGNRRGAPEKIRRRCVPTRIVGTRKNSSSVSAIQGKKGGNELGNRRGASSKIRRRRMESE